MFKLVMAAAKTWHRLKGENQSFKTVEDVTFCNSVKVANKPAQKAV